MGHNLTPYRAYKSTRDRVEQAIANLGEYPTLEDFARIAERFGITRERVRQFWLHMCSEADK